MANTIVYRAIASTGDNEKWTFSGWFKYNPEGQGGSSYQRIFDCGGDTEYLRFTESSGVLIWKSYTEGFTTNRVFKDSGAFYHIVLRVDTTSASALAAGDRFRLYVNGVEETSFSAEVTPDLGHVCKTNTSGNDFVLGGASTSDQNFNGIMSHVHLCDGYSYAPTEFGEEDSISGIWKIKTSPSVSYGTNGFFMKFEDRSNLDLDSGTNAFTFTTSTSGSGALTATYDNPSNNFATFNPGENYYPAATYSNGNTTIVTPSSAVYAPSTSTFGMSGGKWYAEFKTSTTMYDNLYGITDRNATANGQELGDGANQWGYYQTSGSVRYNNGYASPSPYGSSFDNTEVLGIALDLDNSKLYFAIDGTWQNSGDPTSGATGTGALSITAVESTLNGQYFFAVGGWANAASTFHANFGNGYFATTAVSSANADDAGIGAFEYDVPAGYYALCTKNIKAYGG